MAKEKYYFRKPRGEIVKDILFWLIAGGVIAISGGPYIAKNLTNNFLLKKQKHKRQSTENAFRRLYKQGYIGIRKHNHQIYPYLTEEGKKHAGMYQLNELVVKHPKQWDGYWHILLFDISQSNRFVRDALRGIIRELGFAPLQKSVWVHAFNCKDEVDFLRTLFGLTEDEIRLVVSKDIGEDKKLKKLFHVL